MRESDGEWRGGSVPTFCHHSSPRLELAPVFGEVDVDRFLPDSLRDCCALSYLLRKTVCVESGPSSPSNANTSICCLSLDSVLSTTVVTGFDSRATATFSLRPISTYLCWLCFLISTPKTYAHPEVFFCLSKDLLHATVDVSALSPTAYFVLFRPPRNIFCKQCEDLIWKSSLDAFYSNLGAFEVICFSRIHAGAHVQWKRIGVTYLERK